VGRSTSVLRFKVPGGTGQAANQSFQPTGAAHGPSVFNSCRAAPAAELGRYAALSLDRWTLMSLHISVVSIEGDHLDEIADILRKCEYIVEDSFTVPTADQASRELDWSPDRNRVAKVAYVADGWTFIVDPELVLMSDDVWLEYSAKWNTRVIGWVCEGASGSYGLTVFDSGSKRREVLSSDGEVAVNKGKPLPEELDMNWNEAWEDDIVEIAKRLGAEYNFLADREYLVFRLDESQISVPGSSE